MNIKNLIELEFENIKNSTGISKYNSFLNLLLKYQIILEHKINSFTEFFYIDKKDFRENVDLKSCPKTGFQHEEYFQNIESYIFELSNINLNVNNYKEQIKSLNVYPHIKKEIRKSINLILKKIKIKCKDITINTITKFKWYVCLEYEDENIMNNIETIYSWKKIISKLENVSDDEKLKNDIQIYMKSEMEMKQNIYKEYNILLNNKIKFHIISKLKKIINIREIFVEKVKQLKTYYNDKYWKSINIIKHQKLPSIDFLNDLECVISFNHLDISIYVNFEEFHLLILEICNFETCF